MIKKLLGEYTLMKRPIQKRLKEFSEILELKEKDVFAELCFCLLTPQSRAVICDKAVKLLIRDGYLLNGSRKNIRKRLKGVRFPNIKTGNLLSARKLFKKGPRIKIKNALNPSEPAEVREWLVKNVRGLGYKEASHFLRNIGLGKRLAILDVHILKNLRRLGVIKKIPASLTKKAYLLIENKVKRFSETVNIPMDALDLLLWSRETGIIFK